MALWRIGDGGGEGREGGVSAGEALPKHVDVSRIESCCTRAHRRSRRPLVGVR